MLFRATDCLDKDPNCSWKDSKECFRSAPNISLYFFLPELASCQQRHQNDGARAAGVAQHRMVLSVFRSYGRFDLLWPPKVSWSPCASALMPNSKLKVKKVTRLFIRLRLVVEFLTVVSKICGSFA